MTNKLLVHGALFVTFAACSGAQTTPQQSNAGKSPAGLPDYQVIEGRVQRSGVEYTLAGKDGVLHHLSGGNLKQYVGHEVQLSGKPSIKTIDTSQPGAASTAREVPIFVVKSVKDTGSTCQSVH